MSFAVLLTPMAFMFMADVFVVWILAFQTISLKRGKHLEAVDMRVSPAGMGISFQNF
jgi:hypothetical protein